MRCTVILFHVKYRIDPLISKEEDKYDTQRPCVAWMSLCDTKKIRSHTIDDVQVNNINDNPELYSSIVNYIKNYEYCNKMLALVGLFVKKN